MLLSLNFQLNFFKEKCQVSKINVFFIQKTVIYLCCQILESVCIEGLQGHSSQMTWKAFVWAWAVINKAGWKYFREPAFKYFFSLDSIFTKLTYTNPL